VNLFEVLVLAVGLSMDAFAVAICKGLAMKKAEFKSALIVGLWFGGFQGLMPTIGYIIGKQFSSYIDRFDHWIAFVLLAIIGGNMIKESLSKDEEAVQGSLAFKVMLSMAVATSIDAMAAGVSFSFTETIVPIYLAAPMIALSTLLISMFGVKIGNVFGSKYKSKAELVGGCMLILLGLKMLLQGIGVM